MFRIRDLGFRVYDSGRVWCSGSRVKGLGLRV